MLYDALRCSTVLSDESAIDDAEDLDLAILIFNFLEYSLSYSYTTGSLWFYCKDEATNFNDTNHLKSFI